MFLEWARVRPPIRRGAPLIAFAAALMSSACGSSSIAVTGPSTPKCQVSATNSLTSAPADGATGTIEIDTTRDCTWTASSGASWIAITSQAEGQGTDRRCQCRLAHTRACGKPDLNLVASVVAPGGSVLLIL